MGKLGYETSYPMLFIDNQSMPEGFIESEKPMKEVCNEICCEV
jgi:hypothetical protein